MGTVEFIMASQPSRFLSSRYGAKNGGMWATTQIRLFPLLQPPRCKPGAVGCRLLPNKYNNAVECVEYSFTIEKVLFL